MENTIVQLSKYVITFLMICFTVQSFAALKERDEDERHYILMRQIIMIILMNCHLFLRDVPAGGRSINDSDVSAHDGVYPGRTDPVPPDLPEGIDDPGKQHVYAALDQHDYSDETERVKGDVPVQNSGGIHTALLHHSGHCPKGQVPEQSDLDLRCARNCHAFRRYGAWLYFRRCGSCRSKSTALRSSSPRLPRSRSCSLWQACCARIIPLETL